MLKGLLIAAVILVGVVIVGVVIVVWLALCGIQYLFDWIESEDRGKDGGRP